MTKTNRYDKNSEPANKVAINKNLIYPGVFYYSKMEPRRTREQINRQEKGELRRKKLNRMIDIANAEVPEEITPESAAFMAGYRHVFSTANEPDMDAPPGKDDISNYRGFEEAWNRGREEALQAANGINSGGRKSRKRRTRKSKRRKSYKRSR